MGEAKRREAALDAGTPWPRRRVCPVRRCRSVRVRDVDPETEAGRQAVRAYADCWQNRNVASLRVCLDCGSVWEPWPDDAPEDSVERAHTHGPCSNCAYRAGSYEMEDPGARARMLEVARKAAEYGFGAGEPFPTRFCCHKGIPIRVGKDGLEFDYGAAGIEPTRQACTGFLLAMWAEQKKRGRRPRPGKTNPMRGRAAPKADADFVRAGLRIVGEGARRRAAKVKLRPGDQISRVLKDS